MSPLAIALSILWLSWFALACTAYVVVVRRLENRHPETWRDLGRPGVVPRGGVASGRALQGFLLRRGYSKLGDPGLARWGAVANLTMVVMVVALVGGLVWIVVRDLLL